MPSDMIAMGLGWMLDHTFVVLALLLYGGLMGAMLLSGPPVRPAPRAVPISEEQRTRRKRELGSEWETRRAKIMLEAALPKPPPEIAPDVKARDEWYAKWAAAKKPANIETVRIRRRGRFEINNPSDGAGDLT